ncbi:MAG TPA: bifunctional adenosylcobinamide kinase/adenosylcobinamide-phosphate guanylyltransferase [Dehalococcoidia bacterium]|nr:bifunctional adenosylcobinamide kinase/adenosylcobinamide-phosphate guanylyltransferase [Dehalococcoidia bacterium]
MLTFILGGARSGKSELATKLAAASGRDVLFVATMRELDDEMRARVAAHRAERPPSWRTVEAPDDLLAAVHAEAMSGAFVVIDCVTVWLANHLMDALPDPYGAPAEDVDGVSAELAHDVSELASWAAAFDGDVAIVSNDVGAGVVPAYRLGRIFRDATGAANKTLAAAAGRAYYVTAGMALDLRALGALPIDAVARTER